MTEARFPKRRLRRLRRRPVIRDAARDVHLRPEQLICPLFVGELAEPRPVESMPGVYQWPVDGALQQIEALADRGIRQFLFFGVTPEEAKDERGSFAASPDAPVNRLMRRVRERGLDVVLSPDLCFCEYTSHGHCGMLAGGGAPEVVDNEATLEMLGKTAVAQAEAGADLVAPSGMIDGQVQAIRAALDEAGYGQTGILSYAIKFASNFYGPFREAGEGGMAFGDRSGYQMDYRRSREWQSELEQDLAEGADAVMVKPATVYGDVIRRVRDGCSMPVAAYHVSGEYAMLHAAAERGWVDLKPAALETLHSLRRAGADWIVTYFAGDAAAWLAEETR
jgi:porphobilinogen synthase